MDEISTYEYFCNIPFTPLEMESISLSRTTINTVMGTLTGCVIAKQTDMVAGTATPTS